MIEGSCSKCGAAAQQPVGGGQVVHLDGSTPCAFSSLADPPARKSWPPALETKGPPRGMQTN